MLSSAPFCDTHNVISISWFNYIFIQGNKKYVEQNQKYAFGIPISAAIATPPFFHSGWYNQGELLPQIKRQEILKILPFPGISLCWSTLVESAYLTW